jgi:energy-coupling factor transporter ATP-binding protein EcfA2
MEPDVDVLGLIAEIVGPVESGFVSTPVGLTVLYGLNGAGKTQLLRALRSCLEGKASISPGDCDLAVRVSYRMDSHLPDWLLRYAAEWADHDEKVWSPGETVPELFVDPVQLIRRAIVESLNDRSLDDDEPHFWTSPQFGPAVDLEALAAQIAAQGLFLISAEIGEAHTIRVGCLASDDAPLVSAALGRVRANYGSAPEDGDGSGLGDLFQDGEAPFDRVADLRDPRPPLATLWASEKLMRREQVAHVFTDDDGAPDVAKTLVALRALGVEPVKKRKLTEDGKAFLEGLEQLAQVLLDTVLLDAPKLKLRVGTPSDWLIGKAPAWLATTPARPGMDLPLDRLSRAERRWTTLAVALATHISLDRIHLQQPWGRALPLFLILDEPEAALHRSAEAYMADGLLKWAETFNAHVVVASHSPELLDQPSSNLLSVTREKTGGSRVRPLVAPTKETMAEFGLAPSDLLRRQRAFLLVEGTHDEIVLEELIGDELRQARVDVLALRGARNLPATVDSQFLFDYTDAHVVVLLDAIDAATVRDVWAETVTMVTPEDPRKPANSCGNHCLATLPNSVGCVNSSPRRYAGTSITASRHLGYLSSM